MPKLSLTDITSGYNSTSRINAAFAAIEAALENTVSRDGSSPNTMSASLDMNSNRIINLGSPQSSTDAARWADVTGALAISTPVPSQTGNSGKYLTTDGSSLSWSAPQPEPYYPVSSLETSATVVPTDYSYEPGNVLRYGADPTGATSSSTAIQNAINTGHDVIFPSGTYKASGLTQSAANQRFRAEGHVTITKNANGVIFASTGNGVELSGIGFRGDAVSPTYTGNNITFTGDNIRLLNCGSRWAEGRALKITGNHAQVIGTCDIYQTSDATGTGYDIELGVSGTATLYHHLSNVYSSQATGGIKMTDTGSVVIQGSQFGKLFVDAGTSPAGVNGGNYTGNRILGDVTVELSSAVFSGNTFGTVAITLAGGTSGHTIDDSNAFAAGATITDSSTGSNVVDIRVGVPQTYTPSWTAASVNPAIGNGTITGYYVRRGRQVTASVRIVMGSTSTYGTGSWYVSLPVAPSTGVAQQGAARAFDSGTNIRVGVVETLTDGTARCQIMFDSDVASADSTKPFTWTTSDELRFTINYFT